MKQELILEAIATILFRMLNGDDQLKLEDYKIESIDSVNYNGQSLSCFSTRIHISRNNLNIKIHILRIYNEDYTNTYAVKFVLENDPAKLEEIVWDISYRDYLVLTTQIIDVIEEAQEDLVDSLCELIADPQPEEFITEDPSIPTRERLRQEIARTLGIDSDMIISVDEDDLLKEIKKVTRSQEPKEQAPTEDIKSKVNGRVVPAPAMPGEPIPREKSLVPVADNKPVIRRRQSKPTEAEKGIISKKDEQAREAAIKAKGKPGRPKKQ